MPDLPAAYRLHRHGTWTKIALAQVRLGYEARFLRRKRLVTVAGDGFLVDLAETVSLDHGDALELADGRLISVVAAAEEVMIVTGDLTRLAWHIGNRHTPCQMLPDKLLIREDHVLEGMLLGLGAQVRHAVEPFTPEGGAYGHGRTMGHDHRGHDHRGHDNTFGLHHHGDGILHSHAPLKR